MHQRKLTYEEYMSIDHFAQEFNKDGDTLEKLLIEKDLSILDLRILLEKEKII